MTCCLPAVTREEPAVCGPVGRGGEPGPGLAPSGVDHVSSLHKVACNLNASLSDKPPRPQLGGLAVLSMQINQNLTNAKKTSFYAPVKQNMVFCELPF